MILLIIKKSLQKYYAALQKIWEQNIYPILWNLLQSFIEPENQKIEKTLYLSKTFRAKSI